MDCVSIVIPTLNEGENIDTLLSEIFKSGAFEGFDFEIVLVDDASTDGTRERIQKWQSDHPVKLIARDGRRGLSSAVIEGASTAKGDIVVVMDADLSHPPEIIPKLIEPLKAGTHDIAIGSRYAPGGSTLGWPFSRRIMSRFATLLAWPLVDVHDPMSGFFAVHRERLTHLQKDVEGFKILLELLVNGGDTLKTVEIPMAFRERRQGESKLGIRVIWDYLRQLLALAGGNISITSGIRFSVVGISGLLIDLLIFQVLLSKGLALGAAHTISFFIATVMNYVLNARWSFAEKNDAAPNLSSRRYMAFLTVALMAFFMRGGILASLVELMKWPAQAAIMAAIGSAAIVNYIGSAVFIFGRENLRPRSNLHWRILALGVVVYVLVLRLVYLGMPELLQEEAYYWNYAQHLDIGYLDHPPMVALIIWMSTTALNNTEFAVRIGAFICWLITALFAYGLTRNFFDKSTAFRAMILIAILPIFFGAGLIMTPDAPLIACWAGALYFLQRALIGEKNLAWLGAGICIGLGMLSKYTIALLGPATFLFLLVDRPSRRWFLRPEPYVSVLAAALLFSPVIIWNANHEWASFSFQGSQRLQGAFNFSLDKLLGSVMLLLTPTGIGAVIAIIVLGMKKKVEHFRSTKSSIDRGYKFAIVFLLFPLAVFIIFSLGREVKLNWTGPIWLTIVPFIAYHMAPNNFRTERFLVWVQRAWPVTIVASILIYGAVLHYLVLGFPGISYPENLILLGWRDLGRQIEEIEGEIEHRTGTEPLVVGMDKYKIASGLAFYRTKTMKNSDDRFENEGVLHTASRHLFGGNSLMYHYWFPEKGQENRNMILVSQKRSRLTSDLVLSHFQKIGKPHELIIKKNGKPLGRYYYSFAEGYRSKKIPCSMPSA